MNPYSSKPQPELKPVAPAMEQPSLLLYGILLVISVVLIVVAFCLQEKPDWPGLMLNLASGLVGSIVVLIVVDNRMRAHELAALRSVPVRTKEKVLEMLLPSRRLGGAFSRSLLASVDPLIRGKHYVDQFELVTSKTLKGCAIVADPGLGKTTLMHMVAASLARKYLLGDDDGRVPIVFSLKDWLPDRSLEEALFETVLSFTACSRWNLRRLLLSGKAVVLLDGYEALWERQLPLASEIQRLRKKYPEVAWTITARPDHPAPPNFGEVVVLRHPEVSSESDDDGEI